MTCETRPRFSRSGHDLTPLEAARIAEITGTLTPLQVEVTQSAATERPFAGELNANKAAGIYVSVVGGLPLFHSDAKFESGSGWPSFFEPVDPDHIVERIDRAHGTTRTEILDARSGAHLGHVFEDGPPPTGLRYCVNSAALRFIPDDAPLPEGSQPVLETAYFAGGCFWGVEHRFAQVDGVVDAESGYQNGTVSNPTYEQVCSGKTGHAESVKVVFDRREVSYEELLRVFFKLHDPTTANRQGPDVGTQYRSAVFVTNDEQAGVARRVRDELAQARAFGDRPIVTEITQAGRFHRAEGCHQDYHAKQGGSCGVTPR